MVVLSKFGDQLSSLQLDLRMRRQMVGGGALSDHSIGLDVQIPVDTETSTINNFNIITSRREKTKCIQRRS